MAWPSSSSTSLAFGLPAPPATPSSASSSFPHTGRDYHRQNVTQIKTLSAKVRRQAAEAEKAEERRKRRPLKATMAFDDVKSKVNSFGRGKTAAESAGSVAGAGARPFLQGHSKTGPFTDPSSSSRLRSRTESRASADGQGRLALPVDTAERASAVAEEGVSSQLGGAFPDDGLTTSERRERIRGMIRQICAVVPLGDRTFSGGRRGNSRRRDQTDSSASLDRRRRIGGPRTRSASGGGGGSGLLRRSPSVTVLIEEPGETEPFQPSVSHPAFPMRRSPSVTVLAKEPSRQRPQQQQQPPQRSHKISVENCNGLGGRESMTVGDGEQVGKWPRRKKQPEQLVQDEGVGERLPSLQQEIVTTPNAVKVVNDEKTDNVLPHEPDQTLKESNPNPNPVDPNDLCLNLSALDQALDISEDEAKLDVDNSVVDDGGESPRLPIMRGHDVDYVHANIDGASALGHQRRTARKDASSVATQASAAQHKKGTVPRYLRQRQGEWKAEAERREREKPDPDCPPHHVRLPEEERVRTLRDMNDRFERLIVEANQMPVRSDTLRVREKRKRIEEELNQLEEAIRTYSRPKVYVKQ